MRPPRLGPALLWPALINTAFFIFQKHTIAKVMHKNAFKELAKPILEYKTAHERGWMDFDSALMETLLSIRRAGADFIITYAPKKAAALLIKKYI